MWTSEQERPLFCRSRDVERLFGIPEATAKQFRRDGTWQEGIHFHRRGRAVYFDVEMLIRWVRGRDEPAELIPLAGGRR